MTLASGHLASHDRALKTSGERLWGREVSVWQSACLNETMTVALLISVPALNLVAI